MSILSHLVLFKTKGAIVHVEKSHRDLFKFSESQVSVDKHVWELNTIGRKQGVVERC